MLLNYTFLDRVTADKNAQMNVEHWQVLSGSLCCGGHAQPTTLIGCHPALQGGFRHQFGSAERGVKGVCMLKIVIRDNGLAWCSGIKGVRIEKYQCFGSC